MSNNEGKKFLCFLPEVEEPKSLKSVVQHNASSVIVGTERGTKLKTPDELIMDVLKDTCLSRVRLLHIYHFSTLSYPHISVSSAAYDLSSDILNICGYYLFILQNEGWWYYELCYQKKMRQIHQEEDKVGS